MTHTGSVEDNTARSAIVVGLGARGAHLAPLIRIVAATAPVDWTVTDDLSGCLGEMARRSPDLLLMSRLAVGPAREVFELIETCRPGFEGCVVVADDGAIDVVCSGGSWQRALIVAPLIRFCAGLGWSISQRLRERAAPPPLLPPEPPSPPS